MFILDGRKTHYADLPRQVQKKKGKHIHMQHPMRTELFPLTSYTTFHNHIFTTFYFKFWRKRFLH